MLFSNCTYGVVASHWFLSLFFLHCVLEAGIRKAKYSGKSALGLIPFHNALISFFLPFPFLTLSRFRAKDATSDTVSRLR